MDDKKLLEIAKGVSDTKETFIMKEKASLQEIPTNRKKMLLKRRDIRRAVFKIRKTLRAKKEVTNPSLLALKELIDEQLNPNLGMTYESFSHAWDIHPSKPTVIVRKEEWFNAGGTVDPEFGNVKDPTAFTRQD